MLHVVEGEQLPLTQMNGIRLFVHGQDEAVEKENSQHLTSLGFLNSYAIDYYVRKIFACCIIGFKKVQFQSELKYKLVSMVA